MAFIISARAHLDYGLLTGCPRVFELDGVVHLNRAKGVCSDRWLDALQGWVRENRLDQETAPQTKRAFAWWLEGQTIERW